METLKITTMYKFDVYSPTMDENFHVKIASISLSKALIVLSKYIENFNMEDSEQIRITRA